MTDKSSKPKKIFRSPPSGGEDNLSQADKFKEAARELETDQSEETFDRLLKRVAKAPANESGSKKRREDS